MGPSTLMVGEYVDAVARVVIADVGGDCLWVEQRIVRTDKGDQPSSIT